MYESYLEHAKIYGEQNTTLERKMVNQGYNKGNCIWITMEKQHGNTRKNKWFKATSLNGEIYFCKNQSCLLESLI